MAKVNRKTSKQIHVSAKSNESTPSAWFHLPAEIQLKILKYAIENEDYNVVIPRWSRVCKAWCQLASTPVLLKRLHLSNIPDDQRKTVELSREGVLALKSMNLSYCKNLCLAGQSNIRPVELVKIIKAAPDLEVLDLRGCYVSSDLLFKLPDLCPCLTRINLSETACVVSSGYFRIAAELISSIGDGLIEFRLSHSGMSGASLRTLCRAITENSPLLEVLELSCGKYGFFDGPGYLNRTQLMKCCPKLTQIELKEVRTIDRPITIPLFTREWWESL